MKNVLAHLDRISKALLATVAVAVAQVIEANQDTWSQSLGDWVRTVALSLLGGVAVYFKANGPGVAPAPTPPPPPSS